jgi:hypothetical protein
MNNEEIFHSILIKHTNANVKLCVQDFSIIVAKDFDHAIYAMEKQRNA